MEEKDYTYKSNYRYKILPSCSVDLNYFKKLYEILKTATEEGASIEISQLKKKEGDSDEAYEKLKEEARKLYKVTIQIFGAKGEYVYTDTPSIFEDPGLPDNIIKVTFDNTSKFKAILQQREPINKFRLEFDFTKQKVFDFISIPSQATPNRSFVSVLGENETWVSGIYNKILESFSEKTNKRGWVHANNIYDIFLWFMIIPVGLRVLYLINRSLPPRFADLSAFFKIACYLYFFIITLYLFRILFNYARWVFPNIELIQTDKKGPKYHRYILGTIILGVVIALIVDLIKLIF